MFYQSQNSYNAENFKIEHGCNFCFPAHLHENFELIWVKDGQMQVKIDGKSYILDRNEAVLVFPNQVHELSTLNSSEHCLALFSTRIVKAYGNVFSSKIPTDNKIKKSDDIIELIGKIKENDSLLTIKGLFYLLCARFDEEREYVDRIKEKDDLILKIFQFVEKNHSKECSLDDLAKETAYHYAYLSKYFKDRTSLSFTEYVNRYRINEACYLLSNTDSSILKIAMDTGFDSLRSFNRNFKKILSVSPTEYRKKLH